MIDYLKLGRNLSKYAPRVMPREKQFIYSARGIYDLKEGKPEIAEAVNSAFVDVKDPVLDLSVKCGKSEIGIIKVKDGKQEISRDTFVLTDGGKIEEFLPDTDGCIKTFVLDRAGIVELMGMSNVLENIIPKLIGGLKKPKMEVTKAEKRDFSVCKIVLKDEGREILNGFYTKSKIDETANEKVHFTAENSMTTGFGDVNGGIWHVTQRLSEKLRKRLWLLDERTKSMFKMRYGIECSPKKVKRIAEIWGLTGARVRGIINDSKKAMMEADTYFSALGRNLDELGGILSDKERYDLYHKKSSYDINMAQEKLMLRRRCYK